MMTVSENQYFSNKRSSVHKVNDHIVHHDNYDDFRESSNMNSSLITKRGFKPSDMFDPKKKEFLTNLSLKLFPVSWNDETTLPREYRPVKFLRKPPEDIENKHIRIGDKEVELNRLFTPAPDADELIIKKNRKLDQTFASSAFFVPGIHPTVKEQMDLARAISRSLSDTSNNTSKGHNMYINRKKRSVKWVHEGKGRNNMCMTPTPTGNHDTLYRPPPSRQHDNIQTKSFTTYPKPALKTYNIPVTNNNSHKSVPVTHTKLCDAPRISLFNGKNYNTAPRGWGQVKDYYRPVTFDDGGNTIQAYTDY